MSFKDEPFSKRFAKGGMGDLAEGVFESTYPEGWARYGISRPPVNLTNVPAFVRYTPDYLTAKGLVEVQGFGRDQMLKVKVDKLEALVEWTFYDPDFPVHLFLYDSVNRETAWVNVESLNRSRFDTAHVGAFDGGTKPYYAWHKHQLSTDDGWHAL